MSNIRRYGQDIGRKEFLDSKVAIAAFGDQSPSNDKWYTPLVEVNQAIFLVI